MKEAVEDALGPERVLQQLSALELPRDQAVAFLEEAGALVCGGGGKGFQWF